VNQEYMKKFDAALYDDLGTPEAISVMWAMIKDDSLSLGDRRATMVVMDEVLGLGFKDTAAQATVQVSAIPAQVRELAQARDTARANKDFAESDRIRDEIAALGYEVVDGPRGSEIRQSGMVH
jgi:cysteinyl-tRNA synthetase